MNARELILELRKIGNGDAQVFLCGTGGGGVADLRAIETQEHGEGKVDIVYLRTYAEHDGSTILSSSRRIVWQSKDQPE